MEQRTSPGNQERLVRPASPALREVVWWLLRPRSAQDQRREVLAAAEEAYTRLKERLVTSLGTLGFDVLWLRALQLTLRQTAGEEAGAALPTLAPGTSGIREFGDQGDVQALRDLLHLLFTSFFGLLVAFIGEQITFRMIHELWPALPSDEAGSHPKDEFHE